MFSEIEYLVGIGHDDESYVRDVKRDAGLLRNRCGRLGGAIREPKGIDSSLIQWEYIFTGERKARKFSWYASSLETVKTVMLRKERVHTIKLNPETGPGDLDQEQ